MLQIMLFLACILTALLENYQVCFVSLFIKTQEDFLLCAINSIDYIKNVHNIYFRNAGWSLLLSSTSVKITYDFQLV